MRILLYGYEYPPLGGGVANALKNVLEQFSLRDDLEIDFVTSALDNRHSVTKLYDNITVYRIPIGVKTGPGLHRQKPADMLKYMWWSYWLTWKLILKGKYDLAHAFGYPGGLVPLLFRWRMKYVVSLRGIDVPGYNDMFKKWYWIYKPLSKLIWKLASNVNANSSKFTELARKTSQEQHIDIIPNGVKYQKFKLYPEADKFSHFTVTAGATLLGRIKGLDLLVKGFAKLAKDHPEVRLKLIGDGNFKPKLEELIKEQGIEDKVTFTGRQEHTWIEQNLGRFHVLCLPSRNEGMSNAVLEGLAAGLPILITNVGGAQELTANRNGYIIEAESPQDIYAHLKKLFTDNELRRKMSENSRELAETMSWKQTADKFWYTYQQIVNK